MIAVPIDTALGQRRGSHPIPGVRGSRRAVLYTASPPMGVRGSRRAVLYADTSWALGLWGARFPSPSAGASASLRAVLYTDTPWAKGSRRAELPPPSAGASASRDRDRPFRP